MSDTRSADTGEARARRAPQAFDPSDPAVVQAPAPHEPAAFSRPGSSTGARTDSPAAVASMPAATGRLGAGFNWLGLLLAALFGLAGLAASLSFASFVSIALARGDWVGNVAWGLLAIAGVAALVLALGEVIGIMRLGRIARLRRDAEAVQRSGDVKSERAIVGRLRTVLSGRPELAWPLARFREHEGDVRDRGELLALADRELLAPLDLQARRLILGSAKRVSMVTALSPMAFIAVGFVLVENLRLLRRLAGLYGGRPGFLGSLRLARMVFVHLVATGGIALTDDLIGQFIGQDLARRLSQRLGEGVFNGALTARIGTVALDVCRPLPFIEAAPVRIRDVLVEFMRKDPPAKP